MSVSTLVDGVLGSLDAAVRERCDAEGIIDALQSLGCAGSLADLPGGLVGAKGLFGSYYAKVDVSSLQEPTPLALGGMLTMGALRLQDAAVQQARTAPAQAKCATCKSGEGELRACNFCASVFHDTPECLKETRSAAVSHKHDACSRGAAQSALARARRRGR